LAPPPPRGSRDAGGDHPRTTRARAEETTQIVTAALELELSTLYVRSADGALERERRADPAAFFAPPMVAVACGDGGLVWACGKTLPPSIVAEVDARLRTLPTPLTLPGVGWAPDIADELVDLLPGPGERQVSVGPSYVAPLDRTVRGHQVDLRTSNDTDLADVRPLLPERDAVLDPPWAVTIVDGRVAAVCETARSAPLSVEAGVWTYEPHRRRGLGTVVTGAWLDLVGADRTAFYSTSADNHASQGVARRLGLTPIGQWWQVR
jgi:hypothetical protein